ncbi:MAG: T9SS type A sorting domain-containing protein [Bacteroidales bacterium]|nr:T9SS type A sorting domain-containing protein [Bacteroidales bacterium]
MKKLFLLLFLGMSILGYSQSQRLVVFEEFTNASCSPCASQNPAFQALMNANTSKCSYVTYHWNFPGPNDPMYLANPTDMQARIGLYGFNFVPSCVMDGVTIPNCSGGYAGAPACITQNMINTQYAVPSPFELYINQQLSPANDSIYVTVLGKCTAAVSGNLVCQLIVLEKHIHYNSPPGSNGEKDFYNVMRKMLPSAAGTPLSSSYQPGDYFVYKLGWKLANITSLSELNVLGFVQNTQNKAVQQGAITSATPISGVYANDIEVTSVQDFLPTYCVSSLAPVVKFRNTGSQPLTSVTFHYKVNSGAIMDYPWTGNLGFLQEATVQLPAYAFGLENNNTMLIYTDGTNGSGDNYTKNDTVTKTFTAAVQAGTEATLILKTDNYPEETTWDVRDNSGNILASGGPYPDKIHTYTINIPLGFGTCYQFNIYDAGGNGICCGTTGNGHYQLKSGSVIIIGGAAFKSKESAQFYSASGVGLPEDKNPVVFSVYPNPVDESATLSFTNYIPETVEISIFNMQGKAVLSMPSTSYGSGNHEVMLDCSKLAAGIYTVQMVAGDKTFNQKITVK